MSISARSMQKSVPFCYIPERVFPLTRKRAFIGRRMIFEGMYLLEIWEEWLRAFTRRSFSTWTLQSAWQPSSPKFLDLCFLIVANLLFCHPFSPLAIVVPLHLLYNFCRCRLVRQSARNENNNYNPPTGYYTTTEYYTTTAFKEEETVC